MSKLRKWRVETTHVNGYTAPFQIVITDDSRLEKSKVKAIEIAKSQSRLTNFSQYIFTATLLE